MSEGKRTRRIVPKEEKIAALNTEIAKYEDKIAKCKDKIHALSQPTLTMRDVTKRIKESNLSIEEVMSVIAQMESK